MAVEPRFVLVTRRTRLDELLARHTTLAQAKFTVEHLGADFGDYLAEHTAYTTAVRSVTGHLAAVGRVHTLERSLLPNYVFPPDALVVALGQDGLVANTLKYVGERPVLGINPDPTRWDGMLLPFAPKDLASLMPECLAGRRPRRHVSLARARLQDGQELLAVNDLFVGQRTHVSARYELAWSNQTERQSSSGIIVSTGLGSTGWLRSVLTGAAGVEGREAETAKALRTQGLAWDSAQLVFSVREPFPSRSTGTGLVFGRIDAQHPLTVVSQMPENGVIFSDGMETDALAFPAGMRATIDLAAHHGCLLH